MFPLPAAHRANPQDSCPGAVRLHQAADGGLARVRVPGGVLTLAQWQSLIAAAHRLGNGRMELTSRGNLQLRGLQDGDEAALAARLQDAGLLPSPAHERVRNLLASPLSGLDGAGLADVRPLIAEFDRALCARPALTELSGRFLFALDDGRADVLASEPDVAVTATSPAELQPLLAGRPVGAPVPSTAVVGWMLAAAGAFLAERQAQGSNAWRLAELADGPARVAARLGLPGPSGTAGPAGGSEADGRPAPGVAAGDASPGGEPEGSGADPAIARAAGHAPAPGPFRQPDGASALVIGIPLGSLSADQAGALLAPRLILTPWRSIVLPDLTADELAELLASCARLGMITDGSDPLHNVTACTGRPGCASALADVRADAMTVHREFSQPANGMQPVPGVHWSGCARRCGRPAGTVTDVIATDSGYQVHRGNRSLETGTAPAELGPALRADPTPRPHSVPAGAR